MSIGYLTRIRAIEKVLEAVKPGNLGESIDKLVDGREPVAEFVVDRVVSPRNAFNDDQLYVLVRALGRVGTKHSKWLVRLFIHSDVLACREAAVEALDDELDDGNYAFLEFIAMNDASGTIRTAAADAMQSLQMAAQEKV